MHCNLRLSDVALVVLAIMHQLTKFQHNRAMNDWVIDNSAHFPAVFRGLSASRQFSELGGSKSSNCTKVAEDIEQSSTLSQAFCIFSLCCHVSKWGNWKVAVVEKNRSKISHFHSPVKLVEEWARCLSEVFKLSQGPNLWYDGEAARRVDNMLDLGRSFCKESFPGGISELRRPNCIGQSSALQNLF